MSPLPREREHDGAFWSLSEDRNRIAPNNDGKCETERGKAAFVDLIVAHRQSTNSEASVKLSLRKEHPAILSTCLAISEHYPEESAGSRHRFLNSKPAPPVLLICPRL